jgi:predicted short-subunit dehydrogenase-like oxidoreductase (DUF2520 family)
MRLSIIGAGKTGRALGRLARRAGIGIGAVVCRSMGRAREAAAFIGAGEPSTELAGEGLVLVAVPDGEIARVAGRLRVPAGAIVAHVCAAFGAEVLRPHRPAGAVHPLRSFGDPARAAELFRGTACAVDGDPEAVRALRAFVRAIGGKPLEVRSDRKALYHAGAVFASNYVVAALEAALRLFERAGVERGAALEALLPLAEGTLANARTRGVPGALTGPAERGDAETVRRHVRALRRHAPGLSRAYAEMGRVAVEAARAKGSIGRAGARSVGAALGARR